MLIDQIGQSDYTPSDEPLVVQDPQLTTQATTETPEGDDFNIKDYYENKLTSSDQMSDRIINIATTYNVDLDKKIAIQNKIIEETQRDVNETYGAGKTKAQILAEQLGNDVFYQATSWTGFRADPSGELPKIPIHENRNVNEYLYGGEYDEDGHLIPGTGAGIKDATNEWRGIIGKLGDAAGFQPTDILGGENIEKLTLKLLGGKAGNIQDVKDEVTRINAGPVRNYYTQKYGRSGLLETTISNQVSKYLLPVDQQIRNLYKANKYDEAIALGEKLGYQQQFDKNGKFIGFENSVIANEGEAMAESMTPSDIENGEERVRELTYQLVGLSKVVREYGDAVKHEPNLQDFYLRPFTEGKLSNRFDNAMMAVNNMAVVGELVSDADEIQSNHPAAQQFNKILKELLVLNRAVEANVNPTLMKEEHGFTGIFKNPDEYARMTTDQQVDLAPEIFQNFGYELSSDDLRVREGSDWYGLSGAPGEGGIKIFGGELDTRDVVEGSTNFIKNIVPLIASIYATKKVSLGKFSKATRIGGKTKKAGETRTLGDVIKRNSAHVKRWLKGTSDSPTRRRLGDLVVGGMEETVVMTLADQISKNVFDTDPFVFNAETGEFNWEFVFGLGVGNTAGKMFMNKLFQQPLAANIIRKSNQINILDKTSGKLLQQGFGATTGVGAMEIGKIFSGDSEAMELLFQDVDYSKFKEEGFETEEDYREHVEERNDELKFDLMKHIASDWLGMFALGVTNPNSRILEAVGKDIANYNIKYRKISDASKTLGVKEGLVEKSEDSYKEGHVGYDAIEIAKAKKRKEVANDKTLSKEQKIKKQEEITKAAETLHFRNELAEAKRLYKSETKKNKDFENKVIMLNNKWRSGKGHSARDVADIAAMTKAQQRYLKLKLSGGREGTDIHAIWDETIGSYQRVVKGINEILVGKSGSAKLIDPKLRDKLIDEMTDTSQLNIEKRKLQADNKDGINDAKIAIINEKIKSKTEGVAEIAKQFEADFMKRIELETRVAQKLAEDLGADFKIAKNTTDYIAKGGDKKSAGFHDVIDGKSIIVVNPEAALNARTLGTGVHEVGHHILKDVLKDRKTGKISQDGIDVIDQFLENLKLKDPKAYEIIQADVQKKYAGNSKVMDKNGNFYKKNKNEYYEEYLTSYVENLKNKKISLNKSNREILENMIYPRLRKVFPVLGRFSKPYSIENAEGIKRLLDDLYSASERGFSKYEIGRFMQKNAAQVTKGAIETINKKSFSNTKMIEINELAEKFSREDWKGPESDPMSGKWKEVYDQILPDLVTITTKKVNDFVRNTKLPGIDVDRLVWDTVMEMGGIGEGQVKIGGHIRNFDITKKVEEIEGKDFGLSGWINKQINNKMGNVLKKGEATKNKFELSLSEEKVREIVDEGPGIVETVNNQLEAGRIESVLETGKRIKVYEAMADVSKFKGQIAKEINTEIQAPFMVGDKVNEAKLNEFTKDMIYKTVPNLTLGSTVKLFTTTNATYKKGKMAGKPIAPEIARKIKENKDLNIEDIAAVQPFMDKTMSFIVDGWPQGFTTTAKKYTVEIKGKKVERSIQVPDKSTGMPNKILELGYNKRSIRGALTPEGKTVTTKSGPQGQYKIDNIDIKAVKEAVGINRDGTYSQVVTKHSQLTKAIISRFDQLMVNQGLREIMPESLEKRFLQLRDGTSTKRYAKANPNERIPSAEEFMTNAIELMEKISTKGIAEVYDFVNNKPVLKKEFKHISQYTSDYIFYDQYAKGILYDATLDRAIHRALQKLPSGRGPVWEQTQINIAGKQKGVRLLSEKVKEGKEDPPDLDIEIHGVRTPIETKMLNAQHGSITVNSYNINTREAIINKNYKTNPDVLKLVEKAGDGWVKLKNRVYELTNGEIIMEKSNDAIPRKVYDQLIEEGFINGVTIVDKNARVETINELYNKKGVPNYYMNIQSRGLFYMGKNPNAFNVPPLKGDVIMTLRPFRGKETKSGMVRMTYRAIPQLVAKSIPRSTHGLNNALGWKEFLSDPSVKRLERLNSKKILAINNKQMSKVLGKKYSKTSNNEIMKDAIIIDKALAEGRKGNTKARGGSFFDFDETLIDKGENFIIAREPNTGKKVKISSGKWPIEGPKFAQQGYTFDFKDFVKVRGGVEGPMFKKFQERLAKFGPDNMYILTARPPEAATAIYGWLKSKGVKIPMENITGLGNSTGEAKAMWMLEKFSEGYNDMYFVDDALPNVKAVRDVLNQLDIKSKVRQAKNYSKLGEVDLNRDINKIMEHSLDIGSEKVFSKAEAKVRGKDIKRRRVFMRDSAADLELLIEPLYGKSKKGIENKKWLKEKLIIPFERGIRDYNTARQNAKNDYMALRKQNKDIVKEISKEVEGTTFTNDMAMRVYLWNKAGYKIPDLAKTTENKLVEHVIKNPKLQFYAEQFAKITKQEKGLKEPGQDWWAETMAGEVTNIDRGVSRKKFLQEFIDVKNEMFSEANLNKMESKLGTEWRENIEDMFDRMETGRTRSLKMDRGSAMMMNYLNGSIGSIMNFNTRSAALQTISTLNFLNMRENNPIAAAKAMANIPQFSKDFMYIMNSDMLKQRRDGLSINVTEAEIASAAASSKNPIQSIIAKVLKVGYTPTKLADSFAISFGGATFYRNRIKMYEKQGMKTKEAEKQAWLDFQMLSERTQQSSRADLLSKQQTSLIGRFILPFANTPMQMNRAGMKDILDISKGRYKNTAELGEKMGRITYYMGAQIAMFAGLQSGMFALMLNEDDVPEKTVEKSKTYALSSTTDSFLRGFGVQGAVLSAFKNAAIQYAKQSKKPGFSADYTEVGEALLNISPPIGSKFSKLDRAGDMMKWAKIKKQDEFKFELGNPSLEASLLTIEAITNAPLHGWHQNAFNIQHALNDDYEMWQRAHMLGGWTPFQVGIQDDKKEKEKKIKGIKTKGIKTRKIKVKQL
jgi:hypothetical protein